MTPDLPVALAAWAASIPLIRRVYIFGSRAKGTHRPDSDLDIAVELDKESAPGVDDGGIATWMFETEGWQAELQARLAFLIDLQHLAGEHTPHVQQAVDEAGILVYTKH